MLTMMLNGRGDCDKERRGKMVRLFINKTTRILTYNLARIFFRFFANVLGYFLGGNTGAWRKPPKYPTAKMKEFTSTFPLRDNTDDGNLPTSTLVLAYSPATPKFRVKRS